MLILAFEGQDDLWVGQCEVCEPYILSDTRQFQTKLLKSAMENPTGGSWTLKIS